MKERVILETDTQIGDEKMISKRVYTENKKYKEFDEYCIGVDYVEWEDTSKGYIYFEEKLNKERVESFYATLPEALEHYEQADEDYQTEGSTSWAWIRKII
jgi:hypothetical protein